MNGGRGRGGGGRGGGGSRGGRGGGSRRGGLLGAILGQPGQPYPRGRMRPLHRRPPVWIPPPILSTPEPVLSEPIEPISVQRTYERYRSAEQLVPDTDTEALVRSMCNIAKADGALSDEEKARILGEFEDLTDEEQVFLTAELSGERIDVAEFAEQIPEVLAPTAYMFAMMAVAIDTTSEREYLRDFARALGISDLDRDSMHVEMSLDLL